MAKGLGCLAVVVVIVIIAVVALGGTYNRLVGLGQAVDAQWAHVESVYQRRADLIPNLVATVQGAANFERETLEAVPRRRAPDHPAPPPARGPASPRRRRPRTSRTTPRLSRNGRPHRTSSPAPFHVCWWWWSAI